MNPEVDVWFSRDNIMEIVFNEAESLGILNEDGEIKDHEKFTLLMVSIAIDETLGYVGAWLTERGQPEIANDLDWILNGSVEEDDG